MSLSKIDHFDVRDSADVKVTDMGNVVEVMFSAARSNRIWIKKLDSKHFRRLDENGQEYGEVLEFRHIENRSEDVRALRQTFRKIRNIINANTEIVENVKFITFTYAQSDGKPMTDSARLCSDFDIFKKSFYRYLARGGLSKPEYISVVEPQGSGAWHCHVLFIWPTRPPYIPKEDIARIWGHGSITVNELKNHLGGACDNVGAYLTAYLGDIPVDEAIDSHVDITQFEIKEVEDLGQKKYFLKGARLHFYPPKMNIYRTSRGIKKPVETECTYSDAKEKVRGLALTYSSTFQVETHDKFTDEIKKKPITKRYYNKKVGLSQHEQSVEGNFLVDRFGTVLLSDY